MGKNVSDTACSNALFSIPSIYPIVFSELARKVRGNMDFPIEFTSDLDSKEAEYHLYERIEQKFEEFSKGHRDITSASVIIEKPAQGRETTPIYEAKITVFMRPDNIAAVKTHETSEGALRAALDAIERQIRKKRDRLNDNRGSLDDVAFMDPAEDDEDLPI
jgi:ribosomal subunit interface protein